MSLNVYVIIGQRHGSDALEQIGGPIHASEAREAFMPFRVTTKHPEFQRAWLGRVEPEWDSRFTEDGDAAKLRVEAEREFAKIDAEAKAVAEAEQRELAALRSESAANKTLIERLTAEKTQIETDAREAREEVETLRTKVAELQSANLTPAEPTPADSIPPEQSAPVPAKKKK